MGGGGEGIGGALDKGVRKEKCFFLSLNISMGGMWEIKGVTYHSEWAYKYALSSKWNLGKLRAS